MNTINFDDNYFMRQALNEARTASIEGEVPVGAVVVSGGRIIAQAHNLTEKLNDVTAHAEILAVTAATEALGGKYLTDCTLYVTLEPCAMCAGALSWAQLGRLVSGTADPRHGFSKFNPLPLHPKTKWVQGVIANECEQLLKEFFETKRRL